jgi:hypothetical protein
LVFHWLVFLVDVVDPDLDENPYFEDAGLVSSCIPLGQTKASGARHGLRPADGESLLCVGQRISVRLK